MISAVSGSFTFEVLDDLSFAASVQRLPTLPLGAYRFDDLGPTMELARLSTCGLLPPPTQAPWLVLDAAGSLANALRDGLRMWTSREKNLGFLRMQATEPDDQTEENAFKLEAQRAATSVGFPSKLAAQLVGAFEEIHSNVYDHSGTPGSGIAAYRATARRFEFVVSDGGMGVLKSLQSCPAYANVIDHGDALRLALQEGVSRYGKGKSHGKGFRPIFVGLANLNGTLRFRTGDQALTINGMISGDIPTQTSEKVFSPGFVASIVCAL